MIINLINVFLLIILIKIFNIYETYSKYPLVVILTYITYSFFIICSYSRNRVNQCKIVSVQTMLAIYLIVTAIIKSNIYMLLAFYYYSLIIYLF